MAVTITKTYFDRGRKTGMRQLLLRPLENRFKSLPKEEQLLQLSDRLPDFIVSRFANGSGITISRRARATSQGCATASSSS